MDYENLYDYIRRVFLWVEVAIIFSFNAFIYSKTFKYDGFNRDKKTEEENEGKKLQRIRYNKCDFTGLNRLQLSRRKNATISF